MNGQMDQQGGQMAGGQFAPPESLSAGLPWRLMIFAIVLFAFSVFVYFGIHYGYTAFLDQQSADVAAKIEALAKKVSQTDEENFVGFYSQIVNLKTVLDKHAFPSNAFKLLESKVTADVYFTSGAFSSNDNSIDLHGSAKTFDALASQIAIFEKATEVTKVAFNDVNIADTGVTFDIKLNLSPDFLAAQSM